MPKHSLRSRSASTAADALGGNRFLLHASQERGFSITEGFGRWPYSVQRHRTLRGGRLLQRRATPGAMHHWKSIKSTAGAHSINGSLNHRIGFDTTLDIDPHKTTHDELEFAFAEIAWSPNASAMCSQQQPVPGSAGHSTGLRSRHLSKMHHRKSRSSILFQLLTYGTRHAHPDTTRTSILKFSNRDELPKKHNEWPCIFQSVLLAHSPGLAPSMSTAFLSGP